MPSQGVYDVLCWHDLPLILCTVSCFHFVATSCLFPVSSEDNGLGNILSVLIWCLCTTVARWDQIYYLYACKIILSHTCRLFEKLFTPTKKSCHIPPYKQTCIIFTYVHVLPLVAAVCVTLLCQSLPHPEPMWKHFECLDIQNTHLNWQEWKHGIPAKRKRTGHNVCKACSRES